jgi:Bifunctional DNA primase/polymerase, N-terminal/AAA domain/Primase C terminal 1 (PriCT-1)
LNRNLEAAKAYASMSWPVFPLRPRDKRPLSLHGFQDATLDIAQLVRWWAEFPDAGVGIATGTRSGLVVLDVDPRNNGHHSMAAIRAQYGDLGPTPEAQTGGGGRHLFFKLPPGESLPSAKPWPGIDIKADGGYVVACPSVHPSGVMYRWVKGLEPDRLPLAPAPDWLLEILRTRKTQAISTPDPVASHSSGVFLDGSRNASLTSLAGTMQRRGMSPEGILAALTVENEARCRPPLSESEVSAIVQSVARYAPDPEATPPPSPEVLYRFPLMDITGALDEDPPEVSWLLDGWIARGDCALIAGPPGAGKSWITLDIALAGSSGKPILDYWTTAPFRVLHIDEENPPDEVHRRLYQVGLALGIKASALDGRLLMTAPRHGFSFRDAVKVRELHRMVEDFRPDLIILDSLTAISTITEEAKAVEVRRFFHSYLYPLQRPSNAAILCVHHTNKGVYSLERQTTDAGMIRGSIDLIAAPDAAFLLDSVKHSTFSILSNVKPRRVKCPAALKIQIVDAPGGGVRPVVVREDTQDAQTQPAPREALMQAILFKLGEYPEGVETPTLAAAVLASTPGATSEGFKWALHEWVQAGYVESIQGKHKASAKGGRPRSTVRLVRPLDNVKSKPPNTDRCVFERPRKYK